MAVRSDLWLDHFIASSAIGTLCQYIETRGSAAAVGSYGSSTHLLAGALSARLERPVVLVVAHVDEAEEAVSDLEWFRTSDRDLAIEHIVALESLPGQSAVNLELLAQRLAIVERLVTSRDPDAQRKPSVWVAPIQALMQAVPQRKAMAGLSLTIEPGQDLPQNRLIDWLTQAGYQRADALEQPGDFTVRGGIVDILPPEASAGNEADVGVRLDYFGDEIESITSIHPETLSSGSPIDRIRLIGASADQILTDDDTTNVLTLLPDNTLIVIHEMLELSEQARGYYERLTDARGVYSPQAIFQQLTRRTHVRVDQYSADQDDRPLVELPVTPLASFDHGAANAVQELAALAVPENDQVEREGAIPSRQRNNVEADQRVVVLCAQEAERVRLVELIQEHAPRARSMIRVDVGYLHRGFVWGGDETGRLHLVPHHELFHRYQTRRRFRPTRLTASAGSDAKRASDAFFDMEVGDHVVHVEHGIARFTGLRTMKRRGRQGGSEEFLTLEFAKRALLHVPATQIDLVQRYIGGFHGKPPLSVLGGRRWAKQKKQVAEAVKDLASELLRVQAARASLSGLRYPPDTTWQREFEAEFPYEETPDQLAAIAQVKKGMVDDQPMDRLICGDVGFGKTEVAIRAAFKAVEYGKQVAVLVPTTVLAEQHERTFRQRLADYPFRVESISRFKTAGQAAGLLKDLAQGRVDVMIGTHRLVSKDVKFADLGLVIIDEEQRFGVEHKQKLLQLRLTVDVLTLSATPIPRTLHMAMLGLRDISSLTTAPLDRRAVVTEVIPYNEERISQAIHRELNRDGQVFFVHNRVHSIGRVADEIKALVSDARIIIGHGQMPARQLEQVMLRFMRHEADVLVCTTIIESGIDIPTANTIFIDQADHFGLADLHQLRGRVGRYKHRAYCYLLMPKDRPITDVSARRLKAIEQYSMLGAGFKIAMRDLEIRGAGNILGSQQSGHIAAVGYEMYCQLLERAARQLRHEQMVEPARTHLELPVSGYLPKRYISSVKLRIDAYRRLSRAATLQEYQDVVKDITDAFGPPPPKAQDLLDLTELRIAASTLEIDTIRLDGPDLIFSTLKPQSVDPLLQGAPGRVTNVDGRTIFYRPPANYLEPPTLIAVLRKLLVKPITQLQMTRLKADP